MVSTKPRVRSVVILKDTFYRVTKIEGDEALVEPVNGGRAIRRALDDLVVDEYRRGYIDGLDYGKRHMGFGVEYSERQSDEYQMGYERGYEEA